MSEPEDTIPISKFKATCLGVLERVRRTGRPVVVTRFGKPIARVVPPTPGPRAPDWLGSMRDRGSIRGDLISPVVGVDEWEVLGR